MEKEADALREKKRKMKDQILMMMDIYKFNTWAKKHKWKF